MICLLFLLYDILIKILILSLTSRPMGYQFLILVLFCYKMDIKHSNGVFQLAKLEEHHTLSIYVNKLLDDKTSELVILITVFK